MSKRKLLISIFLLLQGTLLLCAVLPSSVFFVNEKYELESTTQEKEGVKYDFKGTKEYPYEDHSIHRKLSFLKYHEPKQDISAKPLKKYDFFKEIRDSEVSEDLKNYPEVKAIKAGLVKLKIKRCKDDSMLLETIMYSPKDRTLCGGGITRYTSQGEIEAYELKAEFLEVPFEKYGEALCELKMI